MAEKTKGKNGETQAAPETKMPKGFRRRSAVTDAPWFTNKEGNVCHGKLLGRYVMQVEPPRPYFQVELYAPCTVTVGRGEDAEEKEAAAGDVVNVGESFKLQALKEIEIPEINAGAEYDVYVEVERKIKLQGGKTMWVIDLGTKRTKAPTGEVRPLAADTASAGAEGEAETPF